MTCPTCGAFEPVMVVRGLTICPTCQRSVVVSTGIFARAADTSVLSDAELGELRRLRATARKASA